MNGVDRIYERGGFQYYGVDLEDAAPEYRDLSGLSGSGLWQQRLTTQGEEKLKTGAPSALTPADLGETILGGIVFYQQPYTRNGNKGLEMYVQKLDEYLVEWLIKKLKRFAPADRDSP